MQWLPVVFGLSALLAALVMAAGGVMKLRHRDAMRKLQTSATGAAGPGPLEVAGRAAPAPKAQLVRGPITSAMGVIVSWRIEERSGGKSDRWIAWDEGRDGGVFAVDDGSGPVLVDVEEADLQIAPTFTETSGLGKDPSAEVRAFLRGKGLKHEGWLGINKRMRFTETLVKVGDPLYVLGVAEVAPSGSGARTLVRTGTRATPFVVSTRTEREARRHALKVAVGEFAGAVVAAALAAVLLVFGFTS